MRGHVILPVGFAGVTPISTHTRVIGRLCLLIGGLLLLINAAGWVWPNDLRARFGVELSYEQALTAMDGQRKLHEPGFDLVKGVTRVYMDSIAYVWPDGLAHVPMRDNWILNASVVGLEGHVIIEAQLPEGPSL